MIIKLQQRAIAVYAADAENAEVEAELRDKVEGGFPMIPPSRLRSSPPARIIRKSSFTISVLATLRFGHNPQIVVIEQGVRHRFRRGADINKQRRPVRDLAGHPPGDTLFLRRLGRFAIVPRC